MCNVMKQVTKKEGMYFIYDSQYVTQIKNNNYYLKIKEGYKESFRK